MVDLNPQEFLSAFTSYSCISVETVSFWSVWHYFHVPVMNLSELIGSSDKTWIQCVLENIALKVKLTFAIVSAAKCEVFQIQLCCIVVISLFGLFLSKLLNSRSLERVLGHRRGQSSRGWEYDRSTEWESRGESPKETLEVNEQLINTLIYSRMH